MDHRDNRASGALESNATVIDSIDAPGFFDFYKRLLQTPVG
jgi:hypothetical protein